MKSIFKTGVYLAIFFLVSFTFFSRAEAAYPDGTETILYHFENNAGILNSGTGSTTYDSSFTGNSAYVNNLGTPFGSYVGTFDTAGDYVDTKYGNGLNPTTTPVSVSLWVNKNTACNSDTGDDHVFGYGLTGQNTRFYIRCTSGNVWGYRLGASAAVTVSGAVSTGRWYHLALTTNGTTVKFYVNGALVSTTSAASYSIGGSLHVGAANATSDQGANALIDEVAIYNNKTLSDGEVAAIYTAGASVYINATTTTATEGGATGSYAVSLKTAPTQNVTVTLSPDAQVTLSAATLTFTTANWFTPQTVTVTAANDATYEGSHTGTVTHSTSSSDTNYSGLTVPSVTATITDNDSDPAPTITNVSSDKTNGTYDAGNIIDIDVTFSEAVTSTGNVTVTLETGTTDRTCTFTVSNATTGTCNYTVQAGDTTSDLTVSTISGTIKNGNLDTMTNFVPATNLAANKAIVVGSYITFVSPTPSAGSTVTSSSISVSAAATSTLTSTSNTWDFAIQDLGGTPVASSSTTTRYGDYNVTHLTNVVSALDMSGVTNNSSGAAYVSTTNTIFFPHNIATGSTSTISEINTSGVELRVITCTSCGDIEGITLISSVSDGSGGYNHTFMISTENDTSNAKIFRIVVPSSGTVTVDDSDYYNITGLSHGGNLGLEGIAYNSANGHFYVATEKTSPTLYEVTLGSSHTATKTTLCPLLDFSSIATDFSDLAYYNNILYVLSHESDRLIPINVSTCAFVDSDGDLNTTNDTGDYLNSIPPGSGTIQPEGVSWDSTGDYLYVINEPDFFTKYRTNNYTAQATLSGLANGDYVLKVTSTDSGSGLITHAPYRYFSVNVDSTAPTITNVSSDKTNGSYTTGEVVDIDVTFSEAVTSTGSVTVTLETGATDRTCTFTVTNTTTGTCNYTVQAGDTTSDLTVNTISGTIADQASNAMSNFVPTTNLAANKAIVIDTTAPTGGITYSDADTTVKAGDTLTITATFSEPLLDSPVVKIAISGSNTVSATNMTKTSSTVYTYAHTVGAGNGTSTVALSIGTDTASNAVTSAPTSGSTFTVDNTAPSNQDTVFSSSTTKQGGASVTIVSSGTASNDVWFAPSGTTVFSASATMTKAANGTATTILAPATEGDYKLFVLDVAGNISSASTATLTVDNTAPVRSAGAPSGTLSLNTTSTDISLSTSAESSTCKYSTSPGTAYGSMTIFSTTNSTAHSKTISGLSNGGSYIYYVKCSDAQGNVNATDYTISFTVTTDTTSPTVEITAPLNNATVSGGTVSIAADATDDASIVGVQFKLDASTNIGAEDTTSTYGVTWDTTSGVSDGSHTITAVARDDSGNSSTSAVITVTVDNTEPTRSAGSPSGALAYGTTGTTLSLHTDEVSTCKYSTSSGIAYGSMTAFSTTSAVDHSNSISGLSDNTAYSYYVKCRDGQSNTNATDYTISFSVAADTDAPNISAVSALTPSDTTATISWDTNEASSSILDYGLTNSYGTSTSETDTSPRVTTHSVSISSLVACSTYHYRVKSKDATNNLGTDSDNTFTTSGCTGSAEVLDEEDTSITTASGGTAELMDSGTGISLDIPAGATGSNAVYQIKSIDQDQAFISSGTPTGVTAVGDYAFDLKALTDTGTSVTSFSEPIEITLTYEDSDVTGIDESSLVIYRYDGSTWTALTGCAVDTTLNTVTCTTSNFSVFSLFGSVTASASSSGTSGTSVHYGCKDKNALNYEYFAASKSSLCKYAQVAVSNPSVPKSVVSVPTKTPTPIISRSLKVGLKGEDVKWLQKSLGGLVADGSFGPKTRSAVIVFQKSHGLVADGIAGKLTVAKLK